VTAGENHRSVRQKKKLYIVAMAIFVVVALFCWWFIVLKSELEKEELVRKALRVAETFNTPNSEMMFSDRTGPLQTRQKTYLENTMRIFPDIMGIRIYDTSRADPVIAVERARLPNPSSNEGLRKRVLESKEYRIDEVADSENDSPFLHVFVPLRSTLEDPVTSVIEVVYSKQLPDSFLIAELTASGLFVFVLVTILFDTSILIERRKKDSDSNIRIKWIERNVEAFLILSVGLAVTFYVSFHAYQLNLHSTERAFQRLAAAETDNVFEIMREVEDSQLEALARFFESSVHVDAEEFHRFAGFLQRKKTVWGWSWAPVVAVSRKSAFEAKARMDGLENFSVRNYQTSQGTFSSDADGWMYPLLFVEPQIKGPSVLGLDLGSIPKLRDALEESLDTALVTSSVPLSFSLGGEPFSGALVFRPVFQRNGEPRGVIAAFLDIKTLLQAYSGENGKSISEIKIFQMEPNGSIKLLGLYGETEEETESGSLSGASSVISVLHAYGKTYIVETPKDPAFWGHYSPRWWLVTSLGGFFVSGSLATFAGAQTWKRRYLRRQVAEKTAALQESEERYRSVFENSHASMLIIDPQDGTIYDANPAAEKFYGWDRQTLKAMKITDINTMSPEDVREEMDKAKKTFQTVFAFRHRRADGSIADVEVFSGPFLIKGDTYLFSVIHDVTSRRKAEEALRDSEERQKAFINTSSEIMFIKDEQLRYVVVNDSACEFLGRPKEEILGKTDFDLMGEKKAELFYRSDIGALQSGNSCVTEETIGERIYETTKFPVPLKRGNKGLGGIIRDVTDQKYHESRLRHVATHDGLTGLANRSLSQDRLEQAILHAKRNGGSVGVLLLDLDRFKVLNDSLGHSFGDELLCAVARRLEGIVRESDTVARLGGDEFVLLLSDVARGKDIHSVALKVVQEISKPYVIANREVTVTASLGFSIFPQDGYDAETLVRLADVAMYEAKRKGRNKVQQYAEGMDRQVMVVHEMEMELRKAVELGKLMLEFQPVANTLKGRVESIEVLTRWNHPTYGIISPADFIPLAEETELIFPIGEWVIEETCRSMKDMFRSGVNPVQFSINLSAVQFRSKNLVGTLEHCLEKYSINPGHVMFELTETQIMHDPEGASEIMKRLSRLGFRIALDDFGTGYSSLNHLRRFPVSIIKIDKSFVHDAVIDPSAAAIAVSIVAIAHNLGLSTVAEGVETFEQLDLVKGWECDAYQGYLLSKPLNLEMMRKFLLDRSDSEMT